MKSDVLKPSPMIACKADLNKIDRYLWNVLYTKAYDHLKSKDVFEVSEQILLGYFPYETRNIEHLKAALKHLTGTLVEYNYLNKDKRNVWGCFTLLGSARLENGMCTYSYAPDLRKMLDNELMYAKISLLISQKFNSKYSLILYELTCDYQGIGKIPWMDLEHFRGLMGIQKEEYPRFNNLKAWVITPALNEVNEKSNWLLKLETKRTGRSISHIMFWIASNKNYQAEIPLFEPTNTNKIAQIKNQLKVNNHE